MPQLLISEVARRAGLRASAIRYYERIGILSPADRVSGQRRYDTTVLYRLAVVQRAREIGFSLREIRELFFGFRNLTPASRRWQTLSDRKLAELESMMKRIRSIKAVLRRMKERCHCETLEQCGKGIFLSSCENQQATRLRRKQPKKSWERQASCARAGSARDSPCAERVL